jgi:hypothetical protein
MKLSQPSKLRVPPTGRHGEYQRRRDRGNGRKSLVMWQKWQSRFLRPQTLNRVDSDRWRARE